MPIVTKGDSLRTIKEKLKTIIEGLIYIFGSIILNIREVFKTEKKCETCGREANLREVRDTLICKKCYKEFKWGVKQLKKANKDWLSTK